MTKKKRKRIIIKEVILRVKISEKRRIKFWSKMLRFEENRSSILEFS